MWFTLNKMAATHFKPDAIKSQKRRSGRGAVSYNITKLTHHSTTTTEGTIQNTQKDVLPTVGPR